MIRKIGLLSIALMGLTIVGGCQTPYGGGCPGGCCGGSCATGQSSYAAPQGGYAPSPPAAGSTFSGGSGSR